MAALRRPELAGPASAGPVDAAEDGLTPEQGALLATVRDDWTEVGFGADATDRAAAQAGVRLTYRSAGLAPPARVVWLASPLRGAVAAALIDDPDPRHGGGPLARTMRDELAAQGLDLAAGDRRAPTPHQVRAVGGGPLPGELTDDPAAPRARLDGHGGTAGAAHPTGAHPGSRSGCP
jgi:hypothetical protein